MSKMKTLDSALANLEAIIHGEPCEWHHLADAFEELKSLFTIPPNDPGETIHGPLLCSCCGRSLEQP